MLAEVAADLRLVVITKQEVEARDTSKVLRILRGLLKPKMIRRSLFRLELQIRGYENDSRELPRIPEVRSFMVQLDCEWPYWFAFCNPKTLSLMFVTFTVCPCRFHPNAVGLEPDTFKRFTIAKFNAVNQLADQGLISEEQSSDVTKRVYRYYRSQMV